MPRRRLNQDEMELLANLRSMQHISPSALELIQHWVERLIAGESLHVVEAEMNRVLSALDLLPPPRK